METMALLLYVCIREIRGSGVPPSIGVHWCPIGG
jgi:hypothetical protein